MKGQFETAAQVREAWPVHKRAKISLIHSATVPSGRDHSKVRCMDTSLHTKFSSLIHSAVQVGEDGHPTPSK